MKKIIFIVGIFSLSCFQNAFSQDTLVLQPGPEGKDSFLDDWYTQPYGDYPNLFAAAGTSNGISVLMRSIVEFDVSSIPEGSVLLDARLSLYFANNPSVPHYQYGDNVAFLQRVIEPWDEETVTWFNQPAVTPSNQVVLPASTDPEQDYLDIDVRRLFQDIVNDPENSHGFLFRLRTEIMYRRMFFASSDYEDPAKWPKLVIIYLDCVPTVDFDYQVTGQSVSFTGISPTATSWHWDFGDGDTSNVQNPEHYYSQVGFYQVCLTVEDTCYFAELCKVIDMCTEPPVSGFTYTTEESNVIFTDTSEMAAEYYWDFGDGYFSSLSNPWHHYELSGIYDVCLITWNSCGSDTICELVEVCELPVSAFNYSIEDLTVFFTDDSQEADFYYWDFGDGYYSNLSDPIHTYDDFLDYNVCLTTWNECGADTVCNMLYLQAVSVPENNEAFFTIYPNPARNEVFITTSINGPVRILLLDLSGKAVLKQEKDLNTGENMLIGLDGIGPGLYIVRIESGEIQLHGKLYVIN